MKEFIFTLKCPASAYQDTVAVLNFIPSTKKDPQPHLSVVVREDEKGKFSNCAIEQLTEAQREFLSENIEIKLEEDFTCAGIIPTHFNVLIRQTDKYAQFFSVFTEISVSYFMWAYEYFSKYFKHIRLDFIKDVQNSIRRLELEKQRLAEYPAELMLLLELQK